MMEHLRGNQHAELLIERSNIAKRLRPDSNGSSSWSDLFLPIFKRKQTFESDRDIFHSPHSSTESDSLSTEASLQQHSAAFVMPWPFSVSSVINNDRSVQTPSPTISKTFNFTSTSSSLLNWADDESASLAPLYADSSDDQWSMASSWVAENESSMQSFAAATLSPSDSAAAAADAGEAAPVWYTDDQIHSIQQQFSPVLPYDWAHAPVQVVLIGFLLCALTVLTVLGNVYVITAVMIVRRLRRPDNLLIVSLATADLLVGLIDMPFAVVYQLKGRWIFSKIVCDLWISFDVLVCTASILNLCMISIDRYLAISRPLHYGIQGRTTRKMAYYIACVWCVAILISIPPLFFFGGNEYIANEKCGYSQSVAYQLYATLGAFYIPLLTTLIVYGQVYRLASRVARAERRSLGNVTIRPSNFQQFLPRASQTLAVPHPNGGVAVQSSTTAPAARWFSIRGKWFFNQNNINNNNNVVSTTNVNKKRFNSQSSTSTPPQSISPTESHASSNVMMRANTVITPESSLPAAANGVAKHHHFTTSTTKTSTHPAPLLRINRNNSSLSTTGGGGGAGQKFIKRERKAMRTLSAITAAFVMCWLPFFILALLAPICSACTIPAWLSATTLWLGYCNSFINPFLYAYFNRDFRTPFRAIMCCQCHKLQDELRVEQFRAQYGSTTGAGAAASIVGAASIAAVVAADRSGSSLHRGSSHSRHNSRHGSSVKAQHQHHHRGSRDTVQTANGSQTGSFRHRRYADLAHHNGSSSGVAGRDGLDSSSGVRAQSIELSSLSTANERRSESPATRSKSMRRVSTEINSAQGVVSQHLPANGGAIVVLDEMPSAAGGLEASSALREHADDEEHGRKRSKRKHRRRNTSEIATNTDITGAMIESYVANKRHHGQQHALTTAARASGDKSLVIFDRCDDEVSRQSDNSSRKSSGRRASSYWTTVSGEETL